MVAVLAVLAILSTVIVPVMIRVFDQMAMTAERKEIKQLVEGLQEHVLRNHNIPYTNTITTAISTEIGLHPDQVLTNGRGLRRVYLLDPAITNTLSIPFNQSWAGITNDLPRLMGAMVISSISRELPTDLVSGFASSPDAFSNLWYAVDGVMPAGWNWDGNPDDLVMERLNLQELFVDLTLNYDTWSVTFTNRGRFTVDNSATNTLPGTNVYTSHYLKGTVLGLHSHGGHTGTLQSSEVLQESGSYVYEIDTWRGSLFTGPGVRQLAGTDLQAAHDVFMLSPWNDNAKGNPAVTQADVTDDMIDYLVTYLDWANRGFPANDTAMIQAKAELDTALDYLIFKASSE
jgi:type II secretory pathway pseudopilin PulG